MNIIYVYYIGNSGVNIIIIQALIHLGAHIFHLPSLLNDSSSPRILGLTFLDEFPGCSNPEFDELYRRLVFLVYGRPNSIFVDWSIPNPSSWLRHWLENVLFETFWYIIIWNNWKSFLIVIYYIVHIYFRIVKIFLCIYRDIINSWTTASLLCRRYIFKINRYFKTFTQLFT